MIYRLSADHTHSPWKGHLDLVYAFEQGKTQLTKAYSQAPFKIQRSFYPEALSVCHNIILHTAGGIVEGDILTQNIHLQPNSNALITTPAATKVYRSQGRLSQQVIKIAIAPGAGLEWLPQETILFNGAQYQQQVRVDLAPEAYWLGWDITRLGRSARGEKFLQGQWKSELEIWQAGQPLWIDRQHLQASERQWKSPHSLGGNPIVASLVWVGIPVSKDLCEQARSLWNSRDTTGEMGVTRSQGDGLVCRYRGQSISEVRRWFVAVWHLLRQTYLQRSAMRPRVWL